MHQQFRETGLCKFESNLCRVKGRGDADLNCMCKKICDRVYARAATRKRNLVADEVL